MKYVLYKVGKHGLGNRLLILTTAVALCRRSGAKLVIDWKSSNSSHLDFWNYFRLEGCEDVLADVQEVSALKGMSSSQTFWDGNYEPSVESIYKKYVATNGFIPGDLQEYPAISGLSSVFRGERQKDVLVLCGYTRKGQSPRILLDHLRFAPEVTDQLRQDLHTTMPFPSDSAYVGLHVRAASTQFDGPDLGKIAKYMDADSRRILVLATDSKTVEDKLRTLMRSRLVCTSKHYPARPNVEADTGESLGLHYIAFNSGGGKSSEGVSAHEVMYQSLLDWCLVAQCPRLFYQPYSTFSHLMLFFGRCIPWRVEPHCAAGMRERAAGAYRSSLKYMFKPRLLQEVL